MIIWLLVSCPVWLLLSDVMFPGPTTNLCNVSRMLLLLLPGENYIDKTQVFNTSEFPESPMFPLSFFHLIQWSYIPSLPHGHFHQGHLDTEFLLVWRGTCGILGAKLEEFSYLISLIKNVLLWLTTYSFYLFFFRSLNLLFHEYTVPAHDTETGSAAAPTFHCLTWRQIDETLQGHLLRVICISCEVEQGLLCICTVPLTSSSVTYWFTLVQIQVNSSLEEPFSFYLTVQMV